MTGTAADPRALVDTNVVVYAYDPADPMKHERARELLRELSDANCLVYSTQVLNEFCSVMMRPTRPSPLAPGRVAVILRNLAATGDVLALTPDMTLLALDAMGPYALSFWDALIWAAAKTDGISVIHTEDFQHGRVIEGVRFHNPFAI
jgi:predicted nucleic acid-binding protein